MRSATGAPHAGGRCGGRQHPAAPARPPGYSAFDARRARALPPATATPDARRARADRGRRSSAVPRAAARTCSNTAGAARPNMRSRASSRGRPSESGCDCVVRLQCREQALGQFLEAQPAPRAGPPTRSRVPASPSRSAAASAAGARESCATERARPTRGPPPAFVDERQHRAVRAAIAGPAMSSADSRASAAALRIAGPRRVRIQHHAPADRDRRRVRRAG